MKKTIIIVMIAVLLIVALCLGILIILTPDPVEPAIMDLHTSNSLVTTLGIEKPDTRIERLFSIRTYQGNIELFDDVRKIAQVGGMEYLELDDKSDEYLLITPFEINGKMEISSLVYDTYEEVYIPEKVVFSCNGGKELPDNYSLLIRYKRPDIPKYEIKLTQEKQETPQKATYQIINTENGKPVKKTQLVKDDIDKGTESIGAEININDSDNND